MKLFEKNGFSYVRLDDDVSFQILRTNPRLTTNTKLIYDGENLYMDAYEATPLLSTMEYKHHKVWKTGLFNRDIRNFLLGTSDAAYTVGQMVENTILLDSYDDQFETMYWCGVESINSDLYPQELGFVAPLYLRKKRPNYFVIFRIDTPANTNSKIQDGNFEFTKDVQNRAKIVKAFDLREGTVIGDYIKRYVEQRDFKYDQSIYVNFSSNEIYYYGIDKKSGVLTEKVENFQEQLLNNDNTIMKADDWITDGFARNGLIFPYIINFEFLFDDKITDEYKFARYFGMYCNDIDLYDLDFSDSGDENTEHSRVVYAGDNYKYTTLIANMDDDEEITTYAGDFYYLKDKNRNIYSVEKGVIRNHFICPGELNIDDFTGFENTSATAYAERMDGVGKAIMILDIKDVLDNGSEVYLFNTIYDDNSDAEPVSNRLGTFVATNAYGKGEYYGNRFSCRGTEEDIAKALAGCIRTCDTDEFGWVTAYSMGTKVILKAMYPGTGINELFDVTFDRITSMGEKIVKLTDKFDGGTDVEGCMFKVYTDEAGVFFDTTETDRDSSRYLRCGIGRENAKIKTVIPYIVDDEYIDDTYSILITDYYGPYVTVSKTNQVELLDKFYAKFGVLSFFPVKDFDFDTVYSAYGEYSLLQKELDYMNTQLTGEEDGSDIDVNAQINYGRFFHHNGSIIGTEYEYYFENLVPELTTENKVTPFINKWGYIDDEKDSCENPYRLNTSKIFETCNFSSNTYMQNSDIMEYTHSMPYYVNNNHKYPSDPNNASENYKNEYQYIEVNDDLWNKDYEEMVDSWIDFFSRKKSDEQGDPFDEIFGDTSRSKFNNKRFNKKYSRFLLGDSVTNSSTLFRGVKFEITEIENGKEVKTGKYNDYRFSFVYVPVEKIPKNTNCVQFIKNDDYKFIVGIVFFDIQTNPDGEDQEFNQAYVYAGSMGYFNLVEFDPDENNEE